MDVGCSMPIYQKSITLFDGISLNFPGLLINVICVCRLQLVHSEQISSELLMVAKTKTELIRSIDVLSHQFDSHNLEADIKHARVIVSRKPSTWVKVSADVHQYEIRHFITINIYLYSMTVLLLPISIPENNIQ